MSFVDTFFNNYSGGGDTSGSTQYANRVYFGVSQPKQIRMKRSGQAISVPGGDDTLSITDAKKLYLTDEELRNKWSKTLSSNGITANPIQARALWELSVDGASDWYSTSNGQQKVTPEQYLTWYSGGQKKKTPTLPTRQVYQVAEDDIAADIDEYLQKRAGRTLQDEDKSQSWYKDLTKAISNLYSKGIVTTVQEIKNPQTGKMEKVVTQTPGFSKEQIAQKITSTIEAADPASVERKKRIDNTKWLLSQGGQR
jgi:hypothetical protein